MAAGDGRQVGVVELGAELRQPALLLLELDHAEPAVVEDDERDRQVVGDGGEQVAQQHHQPAVAAERDDLAVAVERLRAQRLRHRVGHRAEVVGAQQPPLAAQFDEPGQPDRRHPGVGGEDGVVGGRVVDRGGHQLGADPLVGVVRCLRTRPQQLRS